MKNFFVHFLLCKNSLQRKKKFLIFEIKTEVVAYFFFVSFTCSDRNCVLSLQQQNENIGHTK